MARNCTKSSEKHFSVDFSALFVFSVRGLLKPEAIEMFDSFRVLNLVLKSYVLKILLAWLKIARSPPKNISLRIFLRFLRYLREVSGFSDLLPAAVLPAVSEQWAVNIVQTKID